MDLKIVQDDSQLEQKAKEEGAIFIKYPEQEKNPVPTKAFELDTEKLWKQAFSMRKYMLSHNKKPDLNTVINVFNSFYTEQPKIFIKIYNGDNLNFLRNMLDRIKKVQKGSSYEEESKQLGQELFDNYVKPNLKK